MNERTLSVPEIHCDHCKASIEGAVGELAGVEAVNVDIEMRSVEVSYEEALVGIEAIEEAIEGQGYAVE